MLGEGRLQRCWGGLGGASEVGAWGGGRKETGSGPQVIFIPGSSRVFTRHNPVDSLLHHPWLMPPTCEKDINDFLKELSGEIVDIKYQTAISVFSEEQIYCFSAMIIYYED